MNIFVTDVDPVKSAINLDDKRVRHMPKECVEMLAIYIHFVTNQWLIKFPLWGGEDRADVNFLYNHPCSRWIRKDKRNMQWLYKHTLALLEEWEHRFDGVNPIIAEFSIVAEFLDSHLQDTCELPVKFQNSSLNKNIPVIDAYRETMMHKWFVTDKIKPVRWSKRNPPTWIHTQQNLEL